METAILPACSPGTIVAVGSMVRSHGRCDWMRSADGIIEMSYSRRVPNCPSHFYARRHRYVFQSVDVVKMGYPIMTSPVENMAWEIESEYLRRTTGKGLESEIKLIANREEDTFNLVKEERL